MQRIWAASISLVSLVLIIVLPSVLGEFHLALLNAVGISALVVVGLVLVSGIGGAISFGQAAFVGIGAYATAWLTTSLGLSPWLGLLFAVALTAASAWVLGLLTMRLGGHYLALSTIAFGIAIPLVFSATPALGRHSGIIGIPSIEVGPWALSTSGAMFVLIWLTAFCSIWFAYNLLRSRIGRTIRAVRGGDVLLESFGADAFRVRLTLFVLASVYAAIAGWFFAHSQHFVSSAPFSLHASVDYVFMMIIGGMNLLSGAVLGAAIYIGLNDVLQDVLPYLTDRGAQINALVFAVLFLLLLEFLPGGFGNLVRRLVARVWHPSYRPQQPSESLGRRTLPERGCLVLRLDNVVKRFGGLIAVDKVSFDVHAGEIVGLIGPNGAGKSTIFNLLTGTLNATAGTVYFQNKPVSGLSQRDIALRGVARTFQHVKLRPEMTLLDNVALGAHARANSGLLRSGMRLNRDEEARIMDEAMRQLVRVGLGSQAHHAAGTLPLGSQRLLEIARALAADPVLLTLDEPAAGLRASEKQDLAQLLVGLRAEGVAVLLVEHDMGFVMDLVDNLVVVNFGSKIAEGVAAQVRANPEVQKAYLGSDEYDIVA